MNSPDKSGQSCVAQDDKGAALFLAAVVVDQRELFRVGITHVLASMNIHVEAEAAQGREALRCIRDQPVDLLIVGRPLDLKLQHVLTAALKLNPSLKVMILVDSAAREDVARLLSKGADALLLGSLGAAELRNAILRLQNGERVVSSALVSSAAGRFGPMIGLSADDATARSGLSRKELEVLAVLAEGASNKEIAAALIVTQATVKTHLVHIYAKLGVRNRQEALASALGLGLLG